MNVDNMTREELLEIPEGLIKGGRKMFEDKRFSLAQLRGRINYLVNGKWWIKKNQK